MGSQKVQALLLKNVTNENSIEKKRQLEVDGSLLAINYLQPCIRQNSHNIRDDIKI